MPRTIAGAVTKAVLDSLILRRQEKFEEQREQKKHEALSRVSGRPAPVDGDESQYVNDPGSKLREYAEQESCGTCRQALLSLLERPPDRRREGLDVYEDYLETKAAYLDGTASEDEIRGATEALLETAELT